MTFSPHKVTRIIGAALRNTPAEKTTTSPVLAALQRRSTLTGIRLRHSLFTVKNSLPGPLHGDQLNYDNPVSSLPPASLSQPAPQEAVIAGKQVRLGLRRRGGSFEPRTQQRSRAPSCGGKRGEKETVSFDLNKNKQK